MAISIVVDPQVHDIENQLDTIKNYLENTNVEQETTMIKKRYYSIVEAGYQVFSRMPLDKIKPAVFNVLYNTFMRLTSNN